MDIWNILGIIAIVYLFFSFSTGKNAIWGMLTISAVVGLIVRLIYWIAGWSNGWIVFKKLLIVFVLVGGITEILTKRRKSVIQ